MELTQVSCEKGFGIRNDLISPEPFAGILCGSGIEMITSGLVRHPSGHSIGIGLSFASPSGAPPSAHAARVLISVSVSLGSFRKSPYRGSANRGGIFLLRTASLIAFA